MTVPSHEIQPYVLRDVRILTFDIETSPNKSYHWGLWNQNIGLSQILERGGMICWAAKWYGKDRVLFRSAYHDGQLPMVQGLWDLLNEADIVVGWNSARFDVPTANREFLLAGLGLPSPSRDVDLLRTARRRFRFVSNKLDNIATELGVGQKLKHAGQSMWNDCLDDTDPDAQRKAWAVMRRYNKQDVVLTERVYDRLRPSITDHPPLEVWTSVEACNRCGGETFIQGHVSAGQSMYPQMRCQSCGGWARTVRRVGSSATSRGTA